MPKIMKIEFDVDMAKGELPYRAYVSSEPVQDSMFVMVSKVTADDNIFYVLFQCPVTGDTEAKKLMEKAVSHDEFKQAVTLLESDLQKAVPSVKMQRQETGNFAFSDQGPINDGGQLADMLSAAFGGDIQAMADEVIKIDPNHPLSALAHQLKGQLDSGQIDRAQLLITATESTMFNPLELVQMFAGLTPEERKRVNAHLANVKGIDTSNHPLFGKNANQTQHNPYSNNRLNKYL